MCNALQKVKSGDPLRVPAATFNAMIDAARDFQHRMRHLGQQATRGFQSSGIIRVKNVSGTDVGRFGV